MPAKGFRYPQEKRFWSKVSKKGDCWNWVAATEANGRYGTFSRGGRNSRVSAHRFSWELEHGPIPVGMEVCHTCDNGLCVRPEHLFLGTHKENMRDCSRKNRIVALKGTKQPGSKLNDDAVHVIRFFKGKKAASALAKVYGVSSSLVYKIWDRIAWKHVPEHGETELY